jgi:hypothetical protein
MTLLRLNNPNEDLVILSLMLIRRRCVTNLRHDISLIGNLLDGDGRIGVLQGPYEAIERHEAFVIIANNNILDGESGYEH